MVLRQGQLRLAPFVDAVVREETAHSLDWALGTGVAPVSHTEPVFVSAHAADAASITDSAERAALASLLQPGTAGLEETFAAQFAIVYGGMAGVPARQQLVQRRFPRSQQAVRAMVPVP
jgi:hypothetical protein